MPFERVDKIDTLSKDKRNRYGKTLLCVFPPIPPFRRKPAPQTALPLLTAAFLFKVSLRQVKRLPSTE